MRLPSSEAVQTRHTDRQREDRQTYGLLDRLTIRHTDRQGRQKTEGQGQTDRQAEKRRIEKKTTDRESERRRQRQNRQRIDRQIRCREPRGEQEKIAELHL